MMRFFGCALFLINYVIEVYVLEKKFILIACFVLVRR